MKLRKMEMVAPAFQSKVSRHTRSAAFVLLASFSLLGFFPAASHAETKSTKTSTKEAAPKPLSETLTGEAKASYEAGKLLFSDGDSSGAEAKFRMAHEKSGDPRLLWNMAICEKEMRHYARASSLVERYLIEASVQLTEANRVAAQETLTALKSFFSVVELKDAPAGARVLVEGQEVGVTPLAEPLQLDLGTKKLRLEMNGYLPFETTVQIPGNTRVAVHVVLKKEVLLARLIVQGAPYDMIRIDGKLVGEGRYEGVLPPGGHVVRVTGEGKTPYENHIELAPKTTRTMQVTLVEPEGGGSAWPWILGGVALAAGAGVGSYFLITGQEAEVTGPSGDLGSVRIPTAHRF